MKPQELKDRIAHGEHIRLIDVREKEEFAAAEKKLEGAENITMGQMFLEAAKGNLPKDEKIVVTCLKGGRCEVVARELRNRGYDIEHLEGGIEAYTMNP